jgi:hypothetical protein
VAGDWWLAIGGLAIGRRKWGSFVFGGAFFSGETGEGEAKGAGELWGRERKEAVGCISAIIRNDGSRRRKR